MATSQKTGVTGILDRIRTSIYGSVKKDKTADIQAVISKTIDGETRDNLQNQVDMMRSVVGSVVDDKIIADSTMSIATSKSFSTRLARYMDADYVIDNIPYCAKALKVLTNGVLSPDDIKKECIQMQSESDDNPALKKELDSVRNIVKKLSLETKIQELMKDVLKYGDQFIEVCNYKSKDVPITQSLLTESELNEDHLIEELISIPTLNEFGTKDLVEKTVTFEIIEDEEVVNKDNNIDDIKLIIHDPGKVIKLQSRRYKFCLGYLILPESDEDNPVNMRNATSLSHLMVGDMTVKRGIDSVYDKIFTNLNKKMKRGEISVQKKEVKELLLRTIQEFNLDPSQKNKLNLTIRFVPEYRMQHFSMETSRCFPYGEGIFQKIMMQAKIFIALETAVTVRRMSEATEKRIIGIESSLTRDARTVTEQVRSEFNKRKYTVDTMGSLSSVPSMVPNFQDIYLPMSQGKKVVEFDTLPKGTDYRDATDELKLMRDFLVADLDVPAPYLNLEENMSNKNSLAFENAIFAETIVVYQSVLSPLLRNLISKIYKMLYEKGLSEEINITLPPPKMLQIERESERIEFANRSITALVELGAPKEWAKRRMLDLPWDEIEEFRAKEQMDKKLKPPTDEMGMDDENPGMGF